MTATELATKTYELFGAGKAYDILDLMDDSVVWELIGPSSIPYFGTFHGKAGVKEFLDRLIRVEEFIVFKELRMLSGDVSADFVTVFGHEHMRAKSTGREFKAKWVHVFEARDGKILRWTEYIDTAPIVEAYGT